MIVESVRVEEGSREEEGDYIFVPRLPERVKELSK